MSLALPTTTQNVFVEVDGSDVTGTGAFHNPYQTIVHAMATISDASISKRYCIMAGPGTDAGSLVVKPFVYVYNFGGGTFAKITDIDAAGPYVVLPSDYMLCVRYTATDVISINLPSISAAGDGKIFAIIDSGYNAAVKNITLVRNGTDKINNVAGNYTQNVTGSAVWLKANATTSNWEIV